MATVTELDSDIFLTAGSPGATDVVDITGLGSPVVYYATVDLHNVPGGQTVNVKASVLVQGSRTIFDQSVTAAPTPSVLTVGPFPTSGGDFKLTLNQTAGATAFDIHWRLYQVGD